MVRTRPWISARIMSAERGDSSSELAVATAAVVAVRRKRAVLRLPRKLKGFGAISLEGYQLLDSTSSDCI